MKRKKKYLDNKRHKFDKNLTKFIRSLPKNKGSELSMLYEGKIELLYTLNKEFSDSISEEENKQEICEQIKKKTSDMTSLITSHYTSDRNCSPFLLDYLTTEKNFISDIIEKNKEKPVTVHKK